jgi:ABC-type nickel/cobalt efflux system permease component RcnA
MFRRCRVAVLLALVGALLVPVVALAHPLGNFTVNRYSRLEISPQTITVQYVLDLAEIPTFQAMSFLEPNGDGVVTDAAKASYATQRLAEIVPNLRLTIGGVAAPLRVTAWDLELLPGQGDLHTLWLSATLVARTPDALARAGATGLPLTFRDSNEPDRIGWREIVVRGVGGVAVAKSSVSSTDVSHELRNYPVNMVTTPLNEREASAIVVAPGVAPAATAAEGAAPSGATVGVPPGVADLVREASSLLTSVVGSSAATGAAPTQGSDTAPGIVGEVLGQASSLSEIVAAGQLGPAAVALAFLLAALWGAAHAFTPGHGKTIVAAYLVGSRGTARHAVYLGLTVTATHTIGIYALGFLTLVAARFILPESLYPWLSLLSGLAVVVVGIVTLVSRVRNLTRSETSHDHQHHEHNHENQHEDHVHEGGGLLLVGVDHDHPQVHGPGHVLSHERGVADDSSPAGAHRHAHHHGEGNGNVHRHDDGHAHSHLPPGADGGPVTWRSLLALGVAGGILPCPSALVLLLGAIALGQVPFGLALVVAFSVGLAGVLIGIGLAFVYARQLVTARSPVVHPRLGRLLRLAPIGSAVLITLLGLGITFEALGQIALPARF